MELCFLVKNQFLSNNKINSNIQRELLLKSTNAPNIYFNKLDGIIKKIKKSDRELQKDYGIDLDSKPIAFTGRVLPTPRQLNSDMRGKYYRTESAPARWAVFCFDNEVAQEQLTNFENLATDVENNSADIDTSTTDLAAIIEEASASLEEMSATVENLNEQNQLIGTEMKDTEHVAIQITNHS